MNTINKINIKPIATTNYNLEIRKNEEFYKKANAILSGEKYVSQLNNWSINFCYKSR